MLVQKNYVLFIKSYNDLNPEFFSITYGAGGSTRERTLAAINDFNGKGTPVAPHLSCIGDDKARIAELLRSYTNHKELTASSH